MAHSVHYYREHYEDPTHHHGGAWTSLGKSLTDMRFEEELARLAPDKFARALMPGDMKLWLIQNVRRDGYTLHMEQQRHNDFSYTRRAWIEFRNTGDAVLFKLTWGSQP